MSTPAAQPGGATPPQSTPPAPGATPQAPEQTPAPQQGATPEPTLGPQGLEALKREREAREAAEATVSDLNKRLQAIEDKDKDELTREREARERAEAALKATTERVTRYEVAVETGLPANLAKFITGEDKNAMVTNANELKSSLAPGQATSFDNGHRTPPPGEVKPEEQHRVTVLELLRPGSTQSSA